MKFLDPKTLHCNGGIQDQMSFNMSFYIDELLNRTINNFEERIFSDIKYNTRYNGAIENALCVAGYIEHFVNLISTSEYIKGYSPEITYTIEGSCLSFKKMEYMNKTNIKTNVVKVIPCVDLTKLDIDENAKLSIIENGKKYINRLANRSEYKHIYKHLSKIYHNISLVCCPLVVLNVYMIKGKSL